MFYSHQSGDYMQDHPLRFRSSPALWGRLFTFGSRKLHTTRYWKEVAIARKRKFPLVIQTEQIKWLRFRGLPMRSAFSRLNLAMMVGAFRNVQSKNFCLDKIYSSKVYLSGWTSRWRLRGDVFCCKGPHAITAAQTLCCVWYVLCLRFGLHFEPNTLYSPNTCSKWDRKLPLTQSSGEWKWLLWRRFALLCAEFGTTYGTLPLSHQRCIISPCTFSTICLHLTLVGTL